MTRTEPANTQTPTPGRVAGKLSFFLPSMADVIFITLFLGALLLGGTLTNRDGDLGRHLLLGRSVLDTGSIPQVDIYSYTVTGTEIVPHWWLSQTAFAAVERWLGFDGIALLTTIFCALPWFLLYRWSVRRGTPISVAAFVAFLGGIASAIHWAARPHVFTWLFVLACVLLLEDLRTGRRNQVWVLIPLTVLWANVHAGFTIGLLIAATYLVGSLIDSKRGIGLGGTVLPRHLAWITLGMAAATILTPGGVETILNAFAYLGQDLLVDATTEYQSPSFHNPLAWPFLAMILLTISLNRPRDATHLLLALFWTASALFSVRNIPIYAIVVSPILAASLADAAGEVSIRRWPGIRRRLGEYGSIEKSLVGGFAALVIIVVTAFALTSRPGSDFEFDRALFPVDVMTEIGADPPGERAFHMFSWGGYLEYCCHPEVPVFIDGQTDIYGEELAGEYLATINGEPSWRDVLEKHRVDWVIIEPDTALAQVLAEAEDWTETYRDNAAVVFVPAEGN